MATLVKVFKHAPSPLILEENASSFLSVRLNNMQMNHLLKVLKPLWGVYDNICYLLSEFGDGVCPADDQ